MYYIGLIINILVIFDPIDEELTRLVSLEGLRLMQGDVPTTDPLGDLTDITSPPVDVPPGIPEDPTSIDIPEPIDNPFGDPVSEVNRTAMDVLLTPIGMLNFTEGIIDGTRLIHNTTEMDICKGLIRVNFFEQGQTIFNSTLSLKVFPALYSLYDMAYHVHPLVVHCQKAPDNATDEFKASFDDSFDYRVIIENLSMEVDHMIEIGASLYDYFTSTA